MDKAPNIALYWIHPMAFFAEWGTELYVFPG